MHRWMEWIGVCIYLISATKHSGSERGESHPISSRGNIMMKFQNQTTVCQRTLLKTVNKTTNYYYLQVYEIHRGCGRATVVVGKTGMGRMERKMNEEVIFQPEGLSVSNPPYWMEGWVMVTGVAAVVVKIR